MEYTEKSFDKRLRNILIYSGTERESLARFVGVPMPVVNRWLSGASVPDVYQMREIVRFFDVPYEWFLHDGDGTLSTEELAAMLGLRTETVEYLLELAATESGDVLNALDDAVYAVATTIFAARREVYDDQ